MKVLHANKLAHGNLKLSNIFVDDQFENVKIADYGNQRQIWQEYAMRQIKRPLNQRDSINKKLGKIRRGAIQIKQPLIERVLFDYFSIGCCVVELILGKNADSFFKKLIDFESDPNKTPVSLNEIFQMNQMG